MTRETERELSRQTMVILDQQYGGRTDAVLAAAQRFIDDTGGAELKAFLRDTRLGSHPVVVQTIIAKAIKRGYLK
jgi:hypothetical protein